MTRPSRPSLRRTRQCRETTSRPVALTSARTPGASERRCGSSSTAGRTGPARWAGTFRRESCTPTGSVSPNGRSGVRALRDVVGRRPHHQRVAEDHGGSRRRCARRCSRRGHRRPSGPSARRTVTAQGYVGGPVVGPSARLRFSGGCTPRVASPVAGRGNDSGSGLGRSGRIGFSCFTLAVLARQFLGGAIRTTLSSAPSRPSSADCWYSKGQSAVAVGAGGPVQRRRWRQASGSTCRYPSVHGRHRGTRKTGARRSCSADLAASGPTRLEAGGTSRRNVSCRVALTATDALGCWAERSRRTPRAHPQVDHLSSSERTSPMIFVVSCAGSGSPPSASATSAAKSSTEWTPPTRTWRNASPLASGSPAASTASATA